MARRLVSWAKRSVAERRIALGANDAVRRLRALKAKNSGKTFYGILLVEHIGDIIACEPVIRWVRRETPNAFIVWLTKGAYSEMLANHPDLDAVVPVSSLAVVSRIVASRVFDTFLDLHVNDKPTGVENVAHSKTWGDPHVDRANYFAYGSILRAFSTAAGVSIPSEAPRLYVSDAVVRSVDALCLPERFVAVHTTSNEGLKNWLPSEWNELANYIASSCGVPVVEVGLARTITLVHERVLSLCGELSIMQTAEVIRRSVFFIGIDSAVAHMANAWRTPSLLLFGRYRGHDHWIPYDGFFGVDPDRWIMRYGGSLSELPAREVIERLRTTEVWRTTVCIEGLW